MKVFLFIVHKCYTFATSLTKPKPFVPLMFSIDVFKFGGASVRDAAALRNVFEVLSAYKDQRLLVVFSAMGKTTNDLEQIAQTAFEGYEDESISHFGRIKQYHLDVIEGLDVSKIACDAIGFEVEKLFDELKNKIFDVDKNIPFNQYYDQIVCFGELISTQIVSAYLNAMRLTNTLLDARQYIKTDNSFRDARVQWKPTQERIETLKRAFEASKLPKIYVVQGFLGSTEPNMSTTLGREGSDYSASIFAHCLDAQSLTIWKDVAGVMSADPKLFANATKIDALSYDEAVELTYYGASVIHPKTIQPLKIKSIPLFVKSFIKPTDEGTKISDGDKKIDLPCIIFKKNQLLIDFKAQDLTFFAEDSMAIVFQTLSELSIKAHFTENCGRYFSICIDNDAFKVKPFVEKLSKQFDLELTPNLELINIRHYNQTIIDELTQQKTIYNENRTAETAQFLVGAWTGKRYELY